MMEEEENIEQQITYKKKKVKNNWSMQKQKKSANKNKNGIFLDGNDETEMCYIIFYFSVTIFFYKKTLIERTSSNKKCMD